MMRKMIGVVLLFLLPVAGCRQSMSVDTSAAKFIPREVAVEKLKEVLPQVETLGCTIPNVLLERSEVKEWKIDDKGVEFRAAGKEPFRFGYADITSTRLERFHLFYQVRIFTPRQTNPKKDHFHFNWRTEEPARRAIELIEALRQK